MDPNNSHVANGLDRRLEQYRNDPGMQQILTSLLQRAQDAENCVWEIINNRDVDSAIGVQLDILGKIVGRGRGNLTDDDYRTIIKCQILINRSSGTPVDIGKVAILSLPPGFDWTYEEGYPAVIVITLVDTWTGTADALNTVFQNLQQTRSGGVLLFLIYHTIPAANTFTFSPLSAPVPSTTQGFSDYNNPGTGGFFAGVLSG